MVDLFVVGYPRSGNAWLARLLGDVLTSPVMARKPKAAIADEGFDREGDYIIRQEHLCAKDYKDEKPVVLVVRDPRDVAVSAMHYWGRHDLKDALSLMTCGTWPLHHGGGWANFYAFWLENKKYAAIVRYEDLIKDTARALKGVLAKLKIEPVKDIEEVVERQSFDRRKNVAVLYGHLMPYGSDVQVATLRKGVVGDWRNVMDDECKAIADFSFGAVAKEFGYNLHVY
jgi:hypothetical protein